MNLDPLLTAFMASGLPETCPFCASDLTEPDLCPICGSLEGVEEEDEAVVPHSASAAGEEQPQGTDQSCARSSEPQSFFPSSSPCSIH